MKRKLAIMRLFWHHENELWKAWHLSRGWYVTMPLPQEYPNWRMF